MVANRLHSTSEIVVRHITLGVMLLRHLFRMDRRVKDRHPIIGVLRDTASKSQRCDEDLPCKSSNNFIHNALVRSRHDDKD